MNIKYIKIIIVYLIACLFVSSCYAGSNSTRCVDPDLHSTKTNKIVNRFIIDTFKPSLKRVGNNEEYLVKRFGKYKVISKEITLPAYREPGEPEYTELHETWEFDGIILNVESIYPRPHKAKNPYLINKITITKNIFQLTLPVNIGSTKSEIKCQLGNTRSDYDEERNQLVYTIWGGSENGDLTIFLDSQLRAKKIVLEYIID